MLSDFSTNLSLNLTEAVGQSNATPETSVQAAVSIPVEAKQ